MARRRKRRDTRMGVGGVAGDLGYGERGVVESTAMSPMAAGQTGGPQGMAQQGPPNLGMAVEPFAPTDRPDQPITAGLEPDAMMGPNPTDILAAMYRRFPYPDLRRLLERAQMTDWDGMAQQAQASPQMPMQGGMAPDMGMGPNMAMDDGVNMEPEMGMGPDMGMMPGQEF